MVASRAPRKFTWEELAEFNERRNVHVAARGKVYDLTTFVDDHPGGVNQMLLGAGRDVTQLFEMYHDFSVYKVLEKYYIGELVTNELPVYTEAGEFAKVLRKKVKDRFKELRVDPKDPRWTLMRYFWISLGLSFFWYLQTFVYRDIVGSLLISIVFSVFHMLGGFHQIHDASHFAVSHRPWVWMLVGLWNDFVNGMSQTLWYYQHTIGHHPYTNIDHADPDIVTTASSVPDIRRIKITQTWLPRYFHQHFYIPVLYGLVTWKMRIQDFLIALFLHKNGNIRLNKLTPLQWSVFFGGKAFFFFYRIVVPILVGVPVLQVIGLLMFCEMFSSYTIAMIFQVSHVNSDVKFPLPDKNGLIHADWWELQVQTTQDYSTNSWFTTFMTGALNHQTAHHLFPGVAQCFYPLVTPIVKQTCEEFGIEYHCRDSLWDAMKSHVGYLKQMGRDEEARNKLMEQMTNKKLQ